MTIATNKTLWRYFKDGAKYCPVETGYIPRHGDVIFAHIPNEAELIAAFPGYIPATIAAVQEVKDQIIQLENSITPRLLQEAVTGDTAFYKDTGVTAAQFIGNVRMQIALLRQKL